MKLLFLFVILLLSIRFSEQREERREEVNVKRGGISGLVKNGDFIVSTSGRKSNVLNIFQKSSNQWLYRFDNPHGNVNYPHINVNPAITKVRDPHIRMSHRGMKAVGTFGKVAEKVSYYTPYIAGAFLVYDAIDILSEDNKDKQSEKFVQKAAEYTAGYAGAYAGSAIGTAIFPGVGTLIGGLVGGMFGGMMVA